MPTKKLGAHDFFGFLAFNKGILQLAVTDFATLFRRHTEVMMAAYTPPICYAAANKALLAMKYFTLFLRYKVNYWSSTVFPRSKISCGMLMSSLSYLAFAFFWSLSSNRSIQNHFIRD